MSTMFSTMFSDTILIVLISVGTTLLAEVITWALVYRTERYKRLTATLEKQSIQLQEKMEAAEKKEAAGESEEEKKKKDAEMEEHRTTQMELKMESMKSMLVISFLFKMLFGRFQSFFHGRVVAKLPFVPLGYIQGMSHSNLPGEDYTDCSFIFLYVLCTMSVRQNVQKMLGCAPSRVATTTKNVQKMLGCAPSRGATTTKPTTTTTKPTTTKPKQS